MKKRILTLFLVFLIILMPISYSSSSLFVSLNEDGQVRVSQNSCSYGNQKGVIFLPDLGEHDARELAIEDANFEITSSNELKDVYQEKGYSVQIIPLAQSDENVLNVYKKYFGKIPDVKESINLFKNSFEDNNVKLIALFGHGGRNEEFNLKNFDLYRKSGKYNVIEQVSFLPGVRDLILRHSIYKEEGYSASLEKSEDISIKSFNKQLEYYNCGLIGSGGIFAPALPWIVSQRRTMEYNELVEELNKLVSGQESRLSPPADLKVGEKDECKCRYDTHCPLGKIEADCNKYTEDKINGIKEKQFNDITDDDVNYLIGALNCNSVENIASNSIIDIVRSVKIVPDNHPITRVINPLIQKLNNNEKKDQILFVLSEISDKLEKNSLLLKNIFKVITDPIKEEYEKNIEQGHNFKPEYDQHLEHIALYFTGYGDIFETQMDIINQLPQYTKIKLIVNSDFLESLKGGLSQDILSRSTFIVPTYNSCPAVWAQDYSKGDNEVQIVPLMYQHSIFNPQNEFVYKFEEQNIDVRKIPIYFAGGNLFIVKNKEGKKIILNGANDYLHTLEAYEKFGETISENEYKEILKNSFFVDEVILIGTRDPNGKLQNQPSAAFHIDQIMLPIYDGVIAMPSIVDLAKQGETGPSLGGVSIIGGRNSIEDETALTIKNQMDQYREQLINNGFEIVDLKTTVHSITNYQAYTNGIIYTDRDTNQKTIIMPIFPDKNNQYFLEGVNLENIDVFKIEGYNVKVVEDKAFAWRGNLHCVTTLAENNDNSMCEEGVCPV